MASFRAEGFILLVLFFKDLSIYFTERENTQGGAGGVAEEKVLSRLPAAQH